MDLKRCPTFSKLKTLLLSDYWCVALDLDAITCILKNSPLLEKLTLELCLKVYILWMENCCFVKFIIHHSSLIDPCELIVYYRDLIIKWK